MDLIGEIMIMLPHGGPGACFDEQDLINHIKSKSRDYIIQGQQQCSLENHTKPNSLDYWLRDHHSKGKQDTKQAVNEVIQQLVDTGKFVVVEDPPCPDSNQLCKGLRLIQTETRLSGPNDMTTSRVEKLFYKVIPPEDSDYDKAPPISGETQDFKWQLSKDQLAVDMKTHCATESEARGIVEEFLRGWEISTEIQQGADGLGFIFNSSITLKQPTGDDDSRNKVLDVDSSEIILLSDVVRPHVSHARFPEPPLNFRASPEVEMMLIRYKMYREGRESLLGMAYWCLTVVEYAAGGRSEVADQYRVDFRVLRKLGELCGNRGDGMEARKLKGNAGITPLKPTEREWIRAVVKRLILRIGEYAYDPVAKIEDIDDG